MVGEGDVAAARALVVGCGHVAGEGGAGEVGVGFAVVVDVRTRGFEGRVRWVVGGCVRLRHARCLRAEFTVCWIWEVA